MTKERTRERIIYVGVAVLSAILLLVGTFFDESIDKTLFLPQNVPATLVTTLGIYPFFVGIIFFLGVAFQRVASSTMGKVARIAVCAVFVLFALYVGYAGSKSLVDEDCLGGIMPSLTGNTPVIIVLSLVVAYPWFLVAFRAAKRTEDALLLKRALVVVVILIAAFVVMKVTKNIFNRPRYRDVVLGYEGVGFVPWYVISPDPSVLMAKYGLGQNEFCSFPSGHGILSVSSVYILLSLAWVFPKLQGKRFALCLGGFLFSFVIMFTRLLLGAHYLSDVCVGALIGLVLVIVYGILQRRIGDAG